MRIELNGIIMKKLLLFVGALLSGPSLANLPTEEYPEGYDPLVHEYQCKFDENHYAGWEFKDGVMTHEYVWDGEVICSQEGAEQGGCNTDKVIKNDGDLRYERRELMFKNGAKNHYEICHRRRI